MAERASLRGRYQ